MLFNNKLLKLGNILFLFFLIILSGYSIKPIIDINETITINYLSSDKSKASVQADGILSITNPSAVNKIYEITIPLSLDSLIGFSKIDIDNTSKKFNFGFNKIKGQIIEPGETVKVGYKIYGLVNYDIKTNTLDQNKSFLEYYAEDFILASNVIVNVQKANRENGRGDSFGNYTYESGFENMSDRLVATDIRNPTDFDYILEELKVYRTQSSQPIFSESDIIKKFKNHSLLPYERKDLTFIDEDSTDFSVYWVSQKLVIDTILSVNYAFKISLFSAGSGGSSGGGSMNFTDEYSEIIIKKTTDKTLINSGEEFTVTLRVVNLGRSSITELILLDEIPADHEIKDVTKGVRIENGTKLIFDIDEISGYDEYLVSYTLVNINSIKGVTFLKPASADYNDETYYSDGVLIINDLLPDKKVFMQKKVEYIDDNFARVTITVKNLGANQLEDLLVTDFIDENAIIKEISQVFEDRGVWNIKVLKSGEEWEVTYVIERNAKIEILPNIFGVDSDQVYGTLIFSEEVITVFQEQPRTIEKVGMIVAVGLLVFYLLF